MRLKYLLAFYYVPGFLEECWGLFGWIELNIISVGPEMLFAYCHGGRMLCSCSYLATQGVKMVLEKWAKGGITQAKTQTDVPLQNEHFKRRMYWL